MAMARKAQQGGDRMSDMQQEPDEHAGQGLERSKPAHQERLGNVKAVVWKNKTSFGDMYSVTVARIYKSGEEWKESHSFGKDELLVLAKVIDRAHTWICEAKDSRAKSGLRMPKKPE